MQPSNEQLEQRTPSCPEKLLEYWGSLAHTLVPQLNRAAAWVGSHNFNQRLTDGANLRT
jgi:hypothetical protein